MTAEVKFEDGQKQLISEFELHCGIMGSQVLRQDGRTDGHGAFGGGPAGGAEDEAASTDVEIEPAGGAKVVVVDVPGAGDEFGGPERDGPDGVNGGGAWEVRVFGGAAVHLVHTVWVEVMTVVEMVDVV